jgi:hypothetical protein
MSAPDRHRVAVVFGAVLRTARRGAGLSQEGFAHEFAETTAHSKAPVSLTSLLLPRTILTCFVIVAVSYVPRSRLETARSQVRDHALASCGSSC